MAFYDQVINSNPYQQRIGNNTSRAFASQYPVYEQTTPQYPQPNPYNLAQQGYRLNELVYACIEKRKTAISEPPLMVFDTTGETDEEINASPLRKLLKAPCEGVTEPVFHQINEINLLTAGFSIWEKERTRGGDVIHLWPMRPDWCSFLRGDGRPIRAVRYQPYGLPPQEIVREDLVIFMYFDPLFPLLKGLSPTANAMRTIGVDNAATSFLLDFFRRGSVISGLLSTDQSINDIEADRVKQRWGETHGGAENWADNVAVLGKGVKYQPLGMNFRDMAFQELDGRSEARICAVLKVPPILVGAKVGLQASTYSNYEQARQAFYEETIVPQWTYEQAEIDAQLLPDFHDPDTTKVAFNTKKVKALQDDKDKAWKRAGEAAKGNIVTRDEARQEMGLDPIDNQPVFVGATVRLTAGDPLENEIAGNEPQDAGAEVDALTENNTDGQDNQVKPTMPKLPVPKPTQTDQEDAAKSFERKQFREFLKSHQGKGRPFEFKHLDVGEQAAMLTETPARAWRQYP